MAKPKSPPLLPCVTCGWSEIGLTTARAKERATAARVNKSGPFCGLCHHVEMARRMAEARGVDLTAVSWPPQPLDESA